MTSLSQLLSQHTETLTTLYSTLTPCPTPLIEARLSELEELLNRELSKQTLEIKLLISRERERLENGRKKVKDWLDALGEGIEEKEEEGECLEDRVKEVELRIEGLRGRIKQRGEEVVGVQKELIEIREVLGMEWIGVRLDQEEVVKRGEWEGLDLKGERLEELQVERERGRAELVSSPFGQIQKDKRSKREKKLIILRNRT